MITVASGSDNTITLDKLTSASAAGVGVFDVLMRSVKAQLDAEYQTNRIKGSEYATVYLGSLQAVLQTSLDFLLHKQKTSLEAQLLEQQILLAQTEVLKSELQRQALEASLPKITAEIAQLTAQTAVVTQQKLNLVAEALNIEKQGLHLDAQAALSTQQKLNLIAEALNIPTQGLVLVAQERKLRAEYDNLLLQNERTISETILLTQKYATERSQIEGSGVDADSVIGRQKALYEAQTLGFGQEAKHKAAQLMISTYNIRRTTSEDEAANVENKLMDEFIGAAVGEMFESVGITEPVIP